MLEVRNIHKSFGNLEVLKGVDLNVEKGEIISIVGASGAGKTTLLQIMGTLDQPDQGEVLLKNVNPNALGEKKLAAFRNANIGFIFQFHHLLPEFNALENVCMPGYLGGSKKREVEEKARELLALLKLSDRLEHKPDELSGGEQQRVAVARSLINTPEIILADEPSGNLDSQNAKDLHALFFQLRDQLKQTFVIVTHNKELAAMADRTITMHDGKVHFDSKTSSQQLHA